MHVQMVAIVRLCLGLHANNILPYAIIEETADIAVLLDCDYSNRSNGRVMIMATSIFSSEVLDFGGHCKLYFLESLTMLPSQMLYPFVTFSSLVQL